MKLYYLSKKNRGLTLLELVVVLFAVAFLFSVAVMVLPLTRHRESRIGCINSLKQVSLAYRIWAGDNSDLYPTGVSTNSGGAMELAQAGDASAIFLVMSNELSTPKVLCCPLDTNRFAATNFSSDFSNKNISYFTSRDVINYSTPKLCLIGDSNFSVDGIAARSGLLNISTHSICEWLPGRHRAEDIYPWTNPRRRFVGNIAMGDGSVQQYNSEEFQALLEQGGLATNHFILP